MSDLLSIEALRLSLNIAATEQRLALENIASHNLNTSTKRTDFSSLLAEVASLPIGERAQAMSNLSSNWQNVEVDYLHHDKKNTTLDEEVALSMKASGDYQKLAEVLNRKLGLMNLAISGGKR